MEFGFVEERVADLQALSLEIDLAISERSLDFSTFDRLRDEAALALAGSKIELARCRLMGDSLVSAIEISRLLRAESDVLRGLTRMLHAQRKLMRMAR